MEKLNIGIIGSNGFIARNLVEKLINYYDFNKLKLFSRSKILTTPFDVYSEKIECYQMDLKYKKTYENSLNNIDILYILTSDSNPSKSWENPQLEVDFNLSPLLTLLDLSVLKKIKKIIFISSAGTIYGSSSNILTEKSLTKPFSPYGITKLTMEYFLEYYRYKHAINYEIYRISNVYGEYQDTKKGVGIINTILENYLNKKPTIIFGDGKNIRNYIYVKDVAEILSKSLTNNFRESFTINLSSKENVSINTVVKKIEKTLNIKVPIIYKNIRASDNQSIKISNKKLIKRYPDIVFTPIEIGITNTFNNINNLF